MYGVVNEIRIISNAQIKKECESEYLCIERQKEAEKFLLEKVAACLDRLLSNENPRLNLNTSSGLLSLTVGDDGTVHPLIILSYPFKIPL